MHTLRHDGTSCVTFQLLYVAVTRSVCAHQDSTRHRRMNRRTAPPPPHTHAPLHAPRKRVNKQGHWACRRRAACAPGTRSESVASDARNWRTHTHTREMPVRKRTGRSRMYNKCTRSDHAHVPPLQTNGSFRSRKTTRRSDFEHARRTATARGREV